MYVLRKFMLHYVYFVTRMYYESLHYVSFVTRMIIVISCCTMYTKDTSSATRNFMLMYIRYTYVITKFMLHMYTRVTRM